MQDWLVKYPDLALVYALSDTLAVPAVTVTDRANKTLHDSRRTGR